MRAQPDCSLASEAMPRCGIGEAVALVEQVGRK